VLDDVAGDGGEVDFFEVEVDLAILEAGDGEELVDEAGEAA
jgi:hypothetical protein